MITQLSRPQLGCLVKAMAMRETGVQLPLQWAPPIGAALVQNRAPVPAGSPVMLLGLVFHSVTTAQALARLEEMIASREPHYVATPNVDFLVQSRRDPDLHQALVEAPLALCDSTPLLWLSRRLGRPLPERVAGSDLVPELLRLAAEKRYRLFLLGARDDVSATAAARIQTQFPGIVIAGRYSPPFRPLAEMDHADIIERVQAARPDILLVAFGCPKAEKWMARYYRALGVPVLIGVGGTLDFLAGGLKRAPIWMRRAGLEWAYRLGQEPRRLWRRYAGDFWGLSRVLAGEGWRRFSRRHA